MPAYQNRQPVENQKWMEFQFSFPGHMAGLRLMLLIRLQQQEGQQENIANVF